MTRRGQPAAVTPTPKRYARITGTKRVILCGALAFTLCGLFPPWLYNANSSFGARSGGYAFILANGDHAPGDVIDVTRLGIEWLCVLVATGVAWVMIAKPRRLA
jgi:hypothetical protein